MTPEEKANYFTDKYGDKSFELLNDLYEDTEDIEEFRFIVNSMIKSFLVAKLFESLFENA